MRISTGIEGTFAPQTGRNTLSVTGHEELLREDLALIEELGIGEFRYPIPWHLVEQVPGTYDWSFVDRVLSVVHEELELSIIADLLHHTSYPAWLVDGFLSEHFCGVYVKFVRAFAERYPMVTSFTPFNEPTCTLDFCGRRGFWHPYAAGDRPYVRMLQNTATAFAHAVGLLRHANPRTHIVHVDTFEHHCARDRESIRCAEFLNERRFLFEELVLGEVTCDHPLRPYLIANGFDVWRLAWHRDNPVTLDERGGNYYPLSEEELRRGRTVHAPSWNARGFAAVAGDYARRLRCPLSLTETNIQGSVADRISWLKYMLEQAELLADRNIPLQQFAWFPLFDCAGWGCLLQGHDWPHDPQGIYSCNEHWQRVPTALSQSYGRVVRGATSADLPAYRFHRRHDETLCGLLPQMEWEWEDPPEEFARRV